MLPFNKINMSVILVLLLIAVFTDVFTMIWHGILFLINPLFLFKIQRRRYGPIFPIHLGTEKWNIYSRSSLDKYWQLMDYSSADALFYRAKVPHLQWQKIQVKNLGDKTRVSRAAVVYAIGTGTHTDIIRRHVDGLTTFKQLNVPDLQHWCFQLTAQPMMEWILGKWSSHLTPEFYEAANFYSHNFNPMYFFGLKMDKLMSWFPRLFTKLHHHQKNVEVVFRNIYSLYQQASVNLDPQSVFDRQSGHSECTDTTNGNTDRKDGNEYTDPKEYKRDSEQKNRKKNLVDFYFETNSITPDDFVWLMNATLWAAIHYPTLVLYVSLVSILKDQALLQPISAISDKRRELIKGTVKEVLRIYSPALLPRVLLKDSEASKKGTTIAFSPLDYHLDEANYPDETKFNPDRWQTTIEPTKLLTGSKRNWSCPAIEFSADWIATTIDQLFEKYNHWQVNGPIPPINYQMVLLHSTRQLSITLGKLD